MNEDFKIIASKRGYMPKWTDEIIIKEALKYRTRGEWQISSANSYVSAHARGKEFFEKCCSHMKSSAQKNRWTDEKVKNDALKYSYKGEWRENSDGAYRYAYRKGTDFFKECCFHMVPGIYIYWTKKLVLADALKYDTRSNWLFNSPGAHGFARKKGKEFFKTCCSHMNKEIKDATMTRTRKMRWTDEKVTEEALKYNTRGEWQKGSPSTYSKAFRKGQQFFEECCSHMKASPKRNRWTDDLVKNDALKYSCRMEWEKKSRGAQHYARRKGADFLQSCCTHMDIKSICEKDKKSLEDALNFSSRSEWRLKSSGAYQYAKRKGTDFFESCCAHMIRKYHIRWTEESALADALKYETRHVWCLNSSGAYYYAKRKSADFFESCCSHMK